MGGLSLKVAGYGGTKAGPAPSYGTAASFASGVTPTTATQAAFGPGFTAPAPTTADVITPNDGFGLALWVGVAALVALAWVRHTLPR